MDPAEALRSAVEMIDSFEDLETAKKLRNSIIVKVGVHYGPCIAVTLRARTFPTRSGAVSLSQQA